MPSPRPYALESNPNFVDVTAEGGCLCIYFNSVNLKCTDFDALMSVLYFM